MAWQKKYNLGKQKDLDEVMKFLEENSDIGEESEDEMVDEAEQREQETEEQSDGEGDDAEGGPKTRKTFTG